MKKVYISNAAGEITPEGQALWDKCRRDGTEEYLPLKTHERAISHKLHLEIAWPPCLYGHIGGPDLLMMDGQFWLEWSIEFQYEDDFWGDTSAFKAEYPKIWDVRYELTREWPYLRHALRSTAAVLDFPEQDMPARFRVPVRVRVDGSESDYARSELVRRAFQSISVLGLKHAPLESVPAGLIQFMLDGGAEENDSRTGIDGEFREICRVWNLSQGVK